MLEAGPLHLIYNLCMTKLALIGVQIFLLISFVIFVMLLQLNKHTKKHYLCQCWLRDRLKEMQQHLPDME